MERQLRKAWTARGRAVDALDELADALRNADLPGTAGEVERYCEGLFEVAFIEEEGI